MKRVIALLLALALLCGVFAGCSQTQEPSDNNNQPNNNTTDDNKGDDDKEAEPVTLKCAREKEIKDKQHSTNAA